MSQSILKAAASIISPKAADETNAAANADVHKVRAEQGASEDTAPASLSGDALLSSKDGSFAKTAGHDAGQRTGLESKAGGLGKQAGK